MLLEVLGSKGTETQALYQPTAVCRYMSFFCQWPSCTRMPNLYTCHLFLSILWFIFMCNATNDSLILHMLIPYLSFLLLILSVTVYVCSHQLGKVSIKNKNKFMEFSIILFLEKTPFFPKYIKRRSKAANLSRNVKT